MAVQCNNRLGVELPWFYLLTVPTVSGLIAENYRQKVKVPTVLWGLGWGGGGGVGAVGTND